MQTLSKQEVMASYAAAVESNPSPLGLQALLDSAPTSFTAEEVAGLTTYKVPKLAAEPGMCGRGLEEKPFDYLAEVLLRGGAQAAPERLTRLLQRQWVLSKAVARLQELLGGAEWAGIYRALPAGATAVGDPVLVKEAYVGSPSRAFFPLTPAFAATSNNSTVGLTSTAVVIADTNALNPEAPYYVCDTKVLSEACVPILTPDGASCIGIIDAEAWRVGHFTPARVELLLAAAAELGRAGLLAALLE